MTPLNSIIYLFVEGGYLGMSMITILLTLIFFAAWKAPAWVENIGKIAFAVGPIWAFAGLKVTFIPAIYGAIVYVVSQVIAIFQKPRL